MLENLELKNHFVVLEKENTNTEKTIYSFEHYSYVKTKKFIYIYSKTSKGEVKFISLNYNIIIIEYKNNDVKIFNEND